jgi:4-diphosphocytidyl-2-C-methyl-D-erythritol kinase
MMKSEFAPAKINLTLEILGRRPDGYHELRSLVVFAKDVGDTLTIGPGGFAGAEIAGAFADDIAGPNLVDKAVAAVRAQMPAIAPGHLSLTKDLPVASGIGGGSADAAAALRLLASAHPQTAALDWPAIARSLGADVPVCLASKPVVMTGTGEHLEIVSLPGDLHAVLVNPLASVPENKTGQVFAKLGAAPLAGALLPEPSPSFESTSEVIAYAKARGNDLEAPARSLFPIVETVLAELRRLDGNHLVQLSGAGPTCFALFESKHEAEAAASTLKQRQPGWWIRSTALG